MLSIIIPNFNKASYIQNTLQSVVTQDFVDWEAIVVDDGSKDSSKEIIENFAVSDKRIRFIQRTREPKGGAVCRNIGIEVAQGEYLMFFDSDDIMISECLQQRIEYMEKNPELDFAVFPVGTFYKTIGDNSTIWRPKKSKHLESFLNHNLPWHTMSPIWKTSFIRGRLNGFDEAFPRLQDVEFHTRVLLIQDVRYSIVRNVKPCCFYRIDEERNNNSYLQRLQILQRGVELYINRIGLLVRNYSLKKYLRGTLFSFFTRINYFKVQRKITVDDYTEIVNRMYEFMLQSDIFTRKSKEIIVLYNRLYLFGGWKIKGFNFICKNLFIFSYNLRFLKS